LIESGDHQRALPRGLPCRTSRQECVSPLAYGGGWRHGDRSIPLDTRIV